MKNITLALAIALGFCAIEAGAQERGLGSLRKGRSLLGQQGKIDLERKLPDDLRAKMISEEIKEYEQWLTWPEDVRWDNTNIVKMCEKDLNVDFCRANFRCEKWTRGCGRTLIDCGRCVGAMGGYNWKKFNSDGVLIQVGNKVNFEEYIWLTNCAECVTIENRKKWANERGMPYEDAVVKRKAYFDALSARKKSIDEAEKQAAEEKARLAEEREKECAQREAEKEAEREKEREKEREETQKKLAELAEELKRQREESAAEKRGE